jgi:hypothetical protein
MLYQSWNIEVYDGSEYKQGLACAVGKWQSMQHIVANTADNVMLVALFI